MSLVSLAYESQHSLRQWLVGRWYARKRRGGASSLGEGWEPHHVLVVLNGLMGDSVMCTPLLSSMRRAWPRARVTLLGRRHNCELLAACPHIDAFHTVSVDPYTIRRRRQVRELRQWIASQSFDLAVIALGDQFASVIADAEVPVRVGDKGHFLEACLTHHYSIGSARSWGPDERLNALRCLGVRPVDPSSPRLWVSEPARDAARIKLLALGMRAGASYAVLHPFGSTRRQWWPPERVSELARVLVEQWDLDVVLLGGLETKGHASLDMTRGFDATGALSVSELVAVLSDASLVISTDSGPFHVAGALGRPLVGLFRASRQEHAGRYSSAFVLFGEDSQCDVACRWDRCRGVPCRQMSRLTIEDIAAAASRIHRAA